MMKSAIDWEFSQETLITIISRIVERQENLQQESNNSDYNIGLIDGYRQCLDMIKNDLESRGFNAKDFGIEQK